jgi:hypothetical protein
MAHVHAALMLQYAQDAAKTDRPWERWEYSDTATLNQHGEKIRDDWYDCGDNPDWCPNVQYRRKPQVIRVGRHEFPEPISEALEIGMKYWFISFNEELGEFSPFRVPWNGDKVDKAYLDGRVIHLTESAAQAHANVLNAICRGDVE